MELTERYNRIKFISEQRIWLSTASFCDALAELAQIFVRHRANNSFAIALLHRHLDLDPGYALVHSSKEHDTDICRAEELGARVIYPSAYHCDPERETLFSPFEFSSSPLSVPEDEFLIEIATCLRQRNMCEVIAISCLSDPTQAWIETSSHESQVTTAKVAKEKDILSLGDYVVTEWAVLQNSEEIELHATKVCDDKEVGHARHNNKEIEG